VYTKTDRSATAPRRKKAEKRLPLPGQPLPLRSRAKARLHAS